MKVLVTGAAGFIGRNLVARLKSDECPEISEVFEFDKDSPPESLPAFAAGSDFVFHLAGVNRPQNPAEFVEGNVDLTRQLLETLQSSNPGCPVLLTSSAQAALENPYGSSKRSAEEEVFRHSEATGTDVFVFRLPGVFGKWSRPNYNTVVATFCHNIARDIPVRVDDPSAEIDLAYIDDVVDEFIAALRGSCARNDEGYCTVRIVYHLTVGELEERIRGFKAARQALAVPDGTDAFEKKLYATYLSFLPTDEFSYPLQMHCDDRGSFTEIIRTPERGQFSVNISRPGITKGQHWHNTKNEKFAVVSGTGVIRFRKVGEDELLEYFVSGDKIEVVDIPPGYTHNIENLGDADMITFMWANESFDPDRPDTFRLDV